MARFAKILDVAKELCIPNPLCVMIAEYGDFTDEERTIELLEFHAMAASLLGDEQYFKQKLELRIHPWREDTIIISDGYNRAYYRKYATRTVARKLRKRFWTGNLDGRRMNRLAPLWQRIYDVWIAL
jgi:hypothetical protein